MRELLTKLRDLVLPARPDPAQSRRIAEIRLVLCGFIAIAIMLHNKHLHQPFRGATSLWPQKSTFFSL